MPNQQMQTMNEYFDPRRSLSDRFDELSDASAMTDCHEAKTNDAVMGFVNKYLCDYLRVTGTDVPGLQKEVRTKVRQRETEEMPAISRAFTQGTLEAKSDAFGVQCLADTRTTSALVKEIAFNDRFAKGPDEQFMGVDLGAGTSILGAAIAIAARRNAVRRPLVALIDSQQNALEQSERVLSSLQEVDFRTLQMDLRSAETYRLFSPPIWVKYWVSETFGYTTPGIAKLSATQLAWAERGQMGKSLSGTVDPYMDVLENLMRHVPSFYERVKKGQTALFPDPINGHFIPGGQGGRLALNTGPESGPVGLRQVGHEFEVYEDFSVANSRWA